MPVTYVPRTFGGVLILGATPTASTIPTLLVVATFRSGQTQSTYRDGEAKATYRDGTVAAGGR